MSEIQKNLQSCAPDYGNAATRNTFRILPKDSIALHYMVLEIKDVGGRRKVWIWLYRNNIKIHFEAGLIRCDKAGLNEPAQDRGC